MLSRHVHCVGVVHRDLGFNVPLVIPACVLIFAMEVVSILENIVKINPDLENEEIVKLFTNTKN